MSIPPEGLNELVKLLLVAQSFGSGKFTDEQVPELEHVAGCIARSFRQILGVGLTWPMFDDAAKAMVCFLLRYI